jgi:hypothetical protein
MGYNSACWSALRSSDIAYHFHPLLMFFWIGHDREMKKSDDASVLWTAIVAISDDSADAERRDRILFH